MILVTVGTHSKGFERLIKKMDEISGRIDEEVIMQIGSTKYHPKNATFFNFVDSNEKMNELIRSARIVVCHAGAGIIIELINGNKTFIAVPRLKKFGEHLDNQQLELAEVIDKQGLGIAIYEIDLLESAIFKIDCSNRIIKKREIDLVDYLKKYLRELN